VDWKEGAKREKDDLVDVWLVEQLRKGELMSFCVRVHELIRMIHIWQRLGIRSKILPSGVLVELLGPSHPVSRMIIKNYNMY